MCFLLRDSKDTELAVIAFSTKRFRAEYVAQTVKHPPAMWETWVRSLGQEEEMASLKKEMASHSSTLAWRIPGTEEPCRYGP